ncbi:MAG: ATP-dependent Clp protease adaptor ClpS [Candidatus Competibacterales bacterium]
MVTFYFATAQVPVDGGDHLIATLLRKPNPVDHDGTAAASCLKDWLDEITQDDRAGKFAVVLHNDPFNSVEYVTKVIRAVFGYSLAKAVWLMLKAHFTGKATLWLGARLEAERKKAAMIAHGPDPLMVHRGAQALTVTVEKSP